MKRIAWIFSAAALLGGAGGASAQFKAGNVVAVVVEANAPTSAAAPLRVIELKRIGDDDIMPQDGTPTGNFFDLPTMLSGSNHRLTVTGNASYEGLITLSADGNYLLVAGYDAPVGTASVSTTASATVPRVIGRIAWALPPATAIDTTTALTNVFSGSRVSSSASPDGTNFFLAGAGGTKGAVASAALGATAGTASYGGVAVPTLRALNYFEGDLYGVGAVSAATTGTAFYGVGQITPGNTTLLKGFPNTNDSSPADVYFANETTMFVADGDSDDGGIQKWKKFGDTWELQYTFDIPAASGSGVVGVRSLSGSPFFDEDQFITYAELYAITTDNRLVYLRDTDPDPDVTVLNTGAAGEIFRSVKILQPNFVSIGGKVTIEQVDNVQIPLTALFRPLDPAGQPAGGDFTRTTMVTPDGRYRFDNIPAGRPYEIHIRGINTLTEVDTSNTYSHDDPDNDLDLIPCDANGDNVVDTTDFGILVGAYNSDITIPGSGYDPTADFNNDGSVDTTDFGLLVGNYGRIGED